MTRTTTIKFLSALVALLPFTIAGPMNTYGNCAFTATSNRGDFGCCSALVGSMAYCSWKTAEKQPEKLSPGDYGYWMARSMVYHAQVLNITEGLC